MRVAFVSAWTIQHEPTDGAARLHSLATDLVDRGHHVVVFTAQWWEGDPDAFEMDDIQYRAVAASADGWRFPVRLPGAIREFDPDVVHAVCTPPRHLLAARVASFLTGARLIAECYDPPRSRNAFGRSMARAGLRGADVVVTPSRTVRTRIREIGIPQDRIVVVPTGIEWETIRSAEPADGGDIVYSRRLDGAANLETLLLALAEFREYDWTATIVGEGPERSTYERQARDLRIEDRVEFVGERSVEERIALFKDAHVYVHTAEYTPFAIDLLRALAAGCVGIVEYHADSSAHELVEQEHRGFTATNAQELTNRLVAAADIDRRTVDDSFAEFDRRSALERYLDLYRGEQA
ncbi:MAG: glycosyltransferase [Halanaeroarchaeum sp.]